MRAFKSLLSLLFTPIALSTLASSVGINAENQAVLSDSVDDQGSYYYGLDGLQENVPQVIVDGKKNLEKWAHDGREYIKQHGLVYELVTNPAFQSHKLRMTEPQLCDASVKQYSGYLDIAEDKHLFFWFFEARNSPKDAPLLLWLNGGPGCSSSTGLLFELGPCSIAQHGANVTHNPYSWNTYANVIFLDQPVNVGYSFADGDTSVNNSHDVGEDVYAFLQLFMSRFPQYSTTAFHIAAESYGGIYGPNIASAINNKNKKAAVSTTVTPTIKHINLVSLILANGLTDPYVQYGTVPEYACDGPYPVFDTDGPECQSLRAKAPVCQRLVGACYSFPSRFTCTPAALYCNNNLFGTLMQSGRNPYDVRIPCDRSKDGDLCYPQLEWVDTFLNHKSVKAELGVPAAIEFASCNFKVNRDFLLAGDGTKNAGALVPELINDGIRLLVYAGDADMMCNFIGNELWVERMKGHVFAEKFSQAEHAPWVTLGENRKIAGSVRSAGRGGLTAGNVTYVAVFEAGHMVPHDQPEAAFDLINRWLADLPLA